MGGGGRKGGCGWVGGGGNEVYGVAGRFVKREAQWGGGRRGRLSQD